MSTAYSIVRNHKIPNIGQGVPTYGIATLKTFSCSDYYHQRFDSMKIIIQGI